MNVVGRDVAKSFIMMTDEGLKPLPLTVIKVSGPPAGTASGVIDWITGPDCAEAATEKTQRYKTIAILVITTRAGVIAWWPSNERPARERCYKILPSERCFRRHACLLRRSKKVPADLRSIFAVLRKFPQASMPFKTSAESSRSHQHLFRDPEVFCSAAPLSALGQIRQPPSGNPHRVNLPRVADVPERIGICAPEKRPCTPVDAILTPGIAIPSLPSHNSWIR